MKKFLIAGNWKMNKTMAEAAAFCEEIKAKGNGNYEWKEINSAHQFKGVFDGQGHVISGIYMQLGSSAVRGMFGGIGGNAEIKNFTMINSYFGGPTAANKNSLGAIAAKVHKGGNVKISNVTVFATVEETTAQPIEVRLYDYMLKDEAEEVESADVEVEEDDGVI